MWLPYKLRIVRGVNTKNNRCVVCGKTVTTKAVRIAKGSVRGEEWRERSLFGLAHEACFAAAVESPKMVVDELRRASREPRAESTAR